MKYLSIDLGSRRIGIAVSDDKGIVAKPYGTLTPSSDDDALNLISAICEEEHAEEIVLGIPLSASGETQKKYRAFGKKLTEKTGKAVREWDETFTTKQAQNMVAFSDHPEGKKTSKHRDNVAAAIILQEYLDDANPG